MSRGIENSLTSAGLTLIARSLAEGKPVIFTGVSLGTGTAPDDADLSTYTALITPYDTASITTKKVNSAGNLIISASYWNTSVLSSTYIDEIGVFAKVDGDSSSVLFSYLTFGQYPDLILAAAEASVQRTYDIPYAFGSGTSTSVTIVPSGLLPADDAVTVATAGKLLRMDANGKLPTDITGSANKLGGYTYDHFAAADHGHSNATTSAAGFMSAADKAAHDTLVSRVNQGVKSSDSPTFQGLTVNGYIDGATFR